MIRNSILPAAVITGLLGLAACGGQEQTDGRIEDPTFETPAAAPGGQIDGEFGGGAGGMGTDEGPEGRATPPGIDARGNVVAPGATGASGDTTMAGDTGYVADP